MHVCFYSASPVSVSPGARSSAGVDEGSWILKSGTKHVIGFLPLIGLWHLAGSGVGRGRPPRSWRQFQHSHDLSLCLIMSDCPAPTWKYLALDLVSPKVNSAVPNLLAKSIFAGRREDALHHGDAFLENCGGDAGLGAWECKQNFCLINS